MKSLLPFEGLKRDVLVKHDAVTDDAFGCVPEKRPAETLVSYGIVNLNKPRGPTSHMVSEYVQKIFGIDKAGHSGTLDPGVTGVLPVALGRGTRIVQALLNAGKEYVCCMHVHKLVDADVLKKTLLSFVGRITQLPPVRSAVVRQFRERDVYYLDVLEIDGQNVLFRIGCQAGTYIRKLCHDVGRKLNCGAHMVELVRTKAGPFFFDSVVTLQDIEDAFWYWKHENNDKFLRHCIYPVENGVEHLPKVWVFDSAVDSLCHGAILHVPGIVKLTSDVVPDCLVAVMTLKDELIALGSAKKTAVDLMKIDNGVAVVTNKVFMLPDTYKKTTN